MSRGFRRFMVSLISASLLSTLVGCAAVSGNATRSAASDRSDQGLRTAYELLESTLEEEAQLGLLKIFKRFTFQRPVPEIEDIMTRLSDTSKERLEELEALRKIPPDISSPPEFTDPIGDAITSGATDLGMKEMLEFDGSFGLRFIFLQAQATRMVHAIALAAADIETQPDRKKWLRAMAMEYEAYRDELVEIVGKYIMQEGAVQTE